MSPVASSVMPTTMSGVDQPPVKGSVWPPVPLYTDVDATTDLVVVVVVTTGGCVVVVVTGGWVVVVTGGCVVVVVTGGWVVVVVTRWLRSWWW